MAAQPQEVTNEPVNIVSTLSLATGTSYQVRNSGGQTVFLLEAASAPTPPVREATPIHPDHPTFHRTTATIKPNGSEGIWVWCETRGHITVDEVV